MKLVPTSVVRAVSRKILVTKKNSPHIFFGLGVVGTIASTVLACRATLKLSATLDEIKEEVEEVKALAPVPRESEEFKLETLYIYGKASMKLVKLYAPPVALGAASIAMLTGSHVQLVRRNTALMAAYAAVAQAFEEYRERVRAKIGYEDELDIYHNATRELVPGSKEEVVLVNPSQYSPYAKFFDEFSANWKRDPELNRMFVQIQQNYFNHRLNAKGHVFLNEVYDAFDIPRSRAGAVVGWVREGDGDGYIDFGMFMAHNSQFVNGPEQSILLDFNVDGVIYDKI